MKHLREIRKTFVRQLGSNDCGIACLCMILKYAGKETEAISLRVSPPNGHLSLLDLRHVAQTNGLSARCVRMDMEFLNNIKAPCVLHLQGDECGDHFQVYYGMETKSSEKRYLVGDPARGIHYISEEALDKAWKSRAALYLEDLSAKPVNRASSTWHLLLSGALIPTGLLISVPLLSIFIAILGVAWSWALQRGINNSIAETQSHLIEAMIALLFLVTLAKNLFTYVRQQLMIRLNSTVNRHLMLTLISKSLAANEDSGTPHDQMYFKNGVTNTMKMQQAVSAFLSSILSEGSILILVMAALCYQSVIIGLINTVYLVIVTLYILHQFPGMLFDNAHLNELSGSTEKLILRDMPHSAYFQSSGQSGRTFGFHAENHLTYLEFARKVSSRISRNSLVQECLGTLNVICVFVFGVLKLRDWSMSYSAFMVMVILSYFVTALLPKVCSSLFVVYEGIEASRYHKVDPAL